MNIFNRPDSIKLSDEVVTLFCKLLKVTTPKKLSYGYIPSALKETITISKHIYPEETPFTNINDWISITKKKYKKIEFLYVHMRTSRITGHADGHQFNVTKRGNLHRLLLAEKRQKSKIKVVLKKDIMDTITSRVIKHLRLFKRYPDIMNGGLILHGPPGNGKTSIINYLKSKISNYMVIHTNTITNEHLIGDNTPKLYILDDISLRLFNKNDSPSTASYLLDIMDGGRRCKGIWLLSTNEDVKANMHEAFLRPGRFDKIIKFDKPDEDLRREFIESWNLPDINTDNLVELSKGWSFAELAYVKDFVFTKKIIGEDYSVEAAINSREFTGAKEERRIGFQ